MQVHISKSNMKLGKIPSVSLPPVLSCTNCSHCKLSCYALKAWRMYPSTRKAWNENYALLQTDPEGYFNGVGEYLEKYTTPLFRWHVAGDIINKMYMDNMIQLACNYMDTKFLAFTKNYQVAVKVQDILPDNLSIVLSAWPGLDLPITSLPIAFMQDGTETRVYNAIECSGLCESCGKCWNLREIGKNVVFKKH